MNETAHKHADKAVNEAAKHKVNRKVNSKTLSTPKTLTELFACFPAKLFWTGLVIAFILFTTISYVNQSNTSDVSRAKSISQQLRCLECEGLSIYESDTQTSKSIMNDVARRVKDGQSTEEILSYYENIYGEFIRLNPSTEKGNWLIYLFPIFGTAVLAASIFLSIRTSTTRRIKFGFWIATILIAVVGVALFVSDSRRVGGDEVPEVYSNPANTVEKLKEAVKLNPSNENLRNLAIVQFAQEDFVNALSNFDAASKSDNSDAISRAYASYIVMLSGEYELAFSRVQEAVSANQNEPTALFFRGLVYYSIPADSPVYSPQNKELANADFDKVLQLDPDSEFAEQIRELRS